jgi:hypothetical protein
LSRKLLYIQLQKAGQPIDPWTMAEINDIPNFGKPPAGTNTVFDRWVAWEKIKAEIQASTQAMAMQIQARAQLGIQLQQAAIVAQVQQHAAAEQGGAPGGPPQGGAPPQGGPAPAQAGPAGPPPQGGAQGGASGGPGLGPGPALGHNLPGRPPEFGGTPIIEQKDGGTRSTITSHK